jgi:hypothetical protein
MGLIDVFKGNAFGLVSMTAAIEKLPVAPSRLGQLGLFARKPITTTTATIESDGRKLQLLPTKPRGGASTEAQPRKARKVRSFPVPHIPANDEIKAEDVQGVRAFGSETEAQTAAGLVNSRLASLKQAHEVTHEYHRVGAIAGEVKDADGSTVLYNLFDEFGVTEQSEEITLATGDFKVYAAIILRAMRQKLGGLPFKEVRAFCSDDFWDGFINNAGVKEAYKYYATNFLSVQQDASGFNHVGIVWENYTGSVGGIDFIPAGKCRFVPVGVPDLFIEVNAPANFMETVNTPGRPYYAKQMMQKFDTGVDLHTQSNPLMLCTMPEVLIEGVGN